MKLKAIAATLFMMAGIHVYAAQQNQLTTDSSTHDAKTQQKVETPSYDGKLCTV